MSVSRLRGKKAAGTGTPPPTTLLWSALYAAAGDGDPIDIGDGVTPLTVIFDMVDSPNYGLCTMNDKATVIISRAHSTKWNCAGRIRKSGSKLFIGSRAGTGGVIDDPFPITISHTFNATGLRANEPSANKTDPLNATPTSNRADLGQDGSQRFSVCDMSSIVMRTKLGATLNPGDTVLTLAPDMPAVSYPAGTRLVVSDTEYPSVTGGIPGRDSEVVITTTNTSNTRSVPFMRDPRVAGTGAQHRHFGRMQYFVPKALEDFPNTLLSFTPHTWVASDVVQTLPSGHVYTGQMVLDAIAAGFNLNLDHRCGVGVLALPGGIKMTGPVDSDRTVHGYGFSDMVMGPNSIDQCEGIQYTNSGKAGQLGAYSGSHRHIASVIPHGSPGAGAVLADVDATLNFVRKCSVEGGSNRAYVIHATNGLPVEDNVAYDCATHNIFQEDASEKNGTIKRNFVVKVGPVGYGKQAIKVFDQIFDNDVPASNQSAGYELATWKAGPAGLWLTHPTNVVEDNWVHGAYVCIWNAYPKRAFGASRDIPNMSPFRLLPTSHKGNEGLGAKYKAMLSGERQDQRSELGYIVSFGDNTDSFGVNFGDVYQYGDDYINGVGRTDPFAGTHDPIFQNANLGKCDYGAYGNQAWSPRYEGWHVAGIRGGVNTFHNERLAIFGNSSNPRFSFCGFFPNTLDDAYPNAQVSVMLSYGSTPIHANNIVVGSPMAGWHTSSDELSQEGGPMSMWDYYLNSLSNGSRGFFGVASNNLLLGANPGMLGMRLPPPCMFGVVPDFGAEYTAIYTPGTESGYATSTLGPGSAFKLPADKHMMGYTGWWAFKAKFITYNCVGVVDAPVMPGVSSGMNGVIIPNTYDYCGLQCFYNRDALGTQNLLFDDDVTARSGVPGSPAVEYHVVDDTDHTTLIPGAIWPFPKHHPGYSWPNMKHCIVRKGKTYRVVFPNTADVPLAHGLGLVLQGCGNNYTGGGFHVFIQYPWDPAFTADMIDAYPWHSHVGNKGYGGTFGVDYLNPFPQATSLANLYASTSTCFFIDAASSLVHMHIYGMAGYDLAVQINTEHYGL